MNFLSYASICLVLSSTASVYCMNAKLDAIYVKSRMKYIYDNFNNRDELEMKDIEKIEDELIYSYQKSVNSQTVSTKDYECYIEIYEYIKGLLTQKVILDKPDPYTDEPPINPTYTIFYNQCKNTINDLKATVYDMEHFNPQTSITNFTKLKQKFYDLTKYLPKLRKEMAPKILEEYEYYLKLKGMMKKMELSEAQQQDFQILTMKFSK